MSTNPDIPASQSWGATQRSFARGDQATQPSIGEPTPTVGSAAGSNVPPATRSAALPIVHPLLADPFLYLQAEVLDDLERTRIANENRLRQLTRNVEDADGEERGFGLDESHPDVARLAGIVGALAALEHGAELNLKRALRRHPLGAWVKTTIGVGEKQGARLLAAIGDPYWNTLHDRPRTVSQLWAYSGLHVLPAGQNDSDAQIWCASGAQTSLGQENLATQGLYAEGTKPSHTDQLIPDTHGAAVGVAAKRRKGQKANWSATAKSRAYLVATSCIKQSTSPYRPVYDARRARTAMTHPEWSAGHSHNDALRIVSKAILKDLWLAARDIHERPKP